MSQENAEIVRRAVDAWNRRDPDLWRNYATPDVEWTPASTGAVEGTVYRGLDEVLAGLESVWQTWDEVFFEEAEIRELQDATLWLGRLKVRGASSQVALDQEFAVRFVLRGGKLASVQAFLSVRDAIDAVGLATRSPAPRPSQDIAP
jgi:ketosteroid isomerase-like protein